VVNGQDATTTPAAALEPPSAFAARAAERPANAVIPHTYHPVPDIA